MISRCKITAYFYNLQEFLRPKFHQLFSHADYWVPDFLSWFHPSSGHFPLFFGSLSTLLRVTFQPSLGHFPLFFGPHSTLLRASFHSSSGQTRVERGLR